MDPFRADFTVIIPQGNIVPRIDVGGIYLISTTGKTSNTGAENATVDYGINPCQWRALPNEGVLVWKVRHPIESGEEALPVALAVPVSSGSTVSSSGSVTGTTKVPVVDNKGTQVQGSDVSNTSSGGSSVLGYFTEHWVYFNKSAGIFRLMGVQTSPAANSNAETVSAKSK